VAEKKRGLPDSYHLDVSEEALKDNASPVNLGDYLDETVPSAKHKETKIVEFPKPAALPHSEAPKEETAEDTAFLPKQPTRRRRRKRKSPPRKQVNMTDEAIAMTDELLTYIREYSVQKDPKASELFDAIVGAAHHARKFLDLSDLPARGRWGTPTASAFRVNLKKAITRAIYQYHLSQTNR